jgi:hypothetical protein
MKKLLLLLTFLLFPVMANATTYYACATTSSWNSTTGNVWVTSTGNQAACTSATVAGTGNTLIFNSGSTGTYTLNAAFSEAAVTMTGFAGTLTSDTARTLTLTAASVLAGTISGTINFATTTGQITLGSSCGASGDTITFGTGSQTITSGGYVWGGKTTFSGASTKTFTASSIWESTGLCTISATVLLTPSSATLQCDGGLTITSSMNASSVAIINISGGTLTDAGYSYVIYGPLVLGSVNIGTNQYITYNGNSLTLTSSTTTTGNSLIALSSNITITSNGNTFSGSYLLIGQTLTLADNLTLSGSFIVDKGNNTMAGAHNISTPYFEFSSGRNNAGSLTLVSGTTLNVTTGMYVSGFTTNLTSNVGIAPTSYINTTTPGSPAYINYTGTLPNQSVNQIVFTDIQASGGTIYNYGGGTLTRTQGIVNVNASQINKKSVNYYTGV